MTCRFFSPKALDERDPCPTEAALRIAKYNHFKHTLSRKETFPSVLLPSSSLPMGEGLGVVAEAAQSVWTALRSN